jgi:hypothetical protein
MQGGGVKQAGQPILTASIAVDRDALLVIFLNGYVTGMRKKMESRT